MAARIVLAPILAMVTPVFMSMPGQAATLDVGVVNNSGVAVSGISAVSKSTTDAMPVEILASGLAADESGSMVIAVEEGDCIFDLEITFSTGGKLNWSDVDLCHTDGLIVE